MTTYGIISDIHRDPRIAHIAADVLKHLGAEKLVLNGDVGNHQADLQKSQDFVAQVVEAVVSTGLETYVQPGSHESISAYQPVLDVLTARHGNLVDAVRHPVIDHTGHRLVFLPGSDTSPSGEYALGANVPTGMYVAFEDRLEPYTTFNDLHRLVNSSGARGMVRYQNVNDLERHVTDPERTIVICHVPAYFPVGQKGVDFAEYAVKEDKITPRIMLDAMIRQHVRDKFGRDASAEEIVRIAQANGYELRRENVGNKDLREVFDRVGIRYAVNGHIHESGHNAHDRNGNAVEQGRPLRELFWNSGCCDYREVGLLTVGDTGVAYQNIQLRDYLRQEAVA